jgi:hypothetical protein
MIQANGQNADSHHGCAKTPLKTSLGAAQARKGIAFP